MLQVAAECKLGDDSNFFKCVKWSPDGSILLSNAEDNRLRLHSSETLQVLGEACEPERVHDICWYPWMNAQRSYNAPLSPKYF